MDVEALYGSGSRITCPLRMFSRPWIRRLLSEDHSGADDGHRDNFIFGASLSILYVSVATVISLCNLYQGVVEVVLVVVEVANEVQDWISVSSCSLQLMIK